MKNNSLLIGILCLLLGCLSCQKERPGDTIILVGEESYVKSLKELIVIDSLKNVFPHQFGDMPQGLIPPNIEGEYFIDSLQLLHSNYAITENAAEIHLEVSQQHNRVATVRIHQGTTAVTDTAYIMGSVTLSDNDTLGYFTLYLKEEKEINFQDAHSVTRFVVFTGVKNRQGIQNLKYGSIVLDSDFQENLYVGPFTPGAYFIYRDADGLSENSDWFYTQGEGGTP